VRGGREGGLGSEEIERGVSAYCCGQGEGEEPDAERRREAAKNQNGRKVEHASPISQLTNGRSKPRLKEDEEIGLQQREAKEQPFIKKMNSDKAGVTSR